MEERDRWMRLIKDIRAEHAVGILEAERIALARPEWRRWVEYQTNTDHRCRRMAAYHIKHNGDDALLESRDDRYRVL